MESPEVDDTSGTEPIVRNLAVRKRNFLLALFAYAGILGMLVVFIPEDDKLLGFVLGLPIIVLAIAWCYADAEQRAHSIGKRMRIAMILFFAAAFPIYAFQTRGIAGILTIAMAIGLAGAMMSFMIACAFVVAQIFT